MAENMRETRRRRRILEQGSDRLAFITGRIQSLPPITPSSSPADADADADVAPSFQPQPSVSNDQITTIDANTVLPDGKAEEKSDSAVLNCDSLPDPSHTKPDACISESQTPPLHKHEPENEISIVPTSQDTYVQPPPDSPPDILGAEQQSRPQPHTVEPKLLITPSEISSAINASRGTRLCCSVAVALLVVASYLGFSLLGSEFIKSVISFRPLYLVLLTNISVVAARVLSGKQRSSNGSYRRQDRTSSDGDQWDAKLARTLELALVMKNTVDAMFIDCAVYAIIVICGISLLQT